MADIKLTDLPAATSAASTDLLVVVSDPGGSPATKKITLANLVKVTNGTPTGSVNGSNATFTVVAPIIGVFILILNGAVQTGAGVDYTLTGTSLVYVTAPPTGSIHRYISI